MGEELWIGDYLTHDRLGRGGMGVVYSATHRSSGRRVALKTVNAANEFAFASLRREIHALSRVNHPGIVRVLDQGVHEGLPWYAMELIEGRTLLSHVFDSAAFPKPESSGVWGAETITDEPLSIAPESFAPTQVADSDALGLGSDSGPVSSSIRHEPVSGLPPLLQRVQAVLPILSRLCSALAFLHGEGIVHRDLKPENIIIRGDQMPVLVDFGIASEFSGSRGRDALAHSATAMGTAAYIAPEQVKNELVDARADLYSLGCILYELISGRPPFLADSVGNLLRAQLYEPPAPLTEFAPDTPPALNELVMRLLAKQPAQRLGYALDVKRSLLELFQDEVPSSMGPAPSSYLYQPELAGREKELEVLRDVTEAAIRGTGGVCFVSGESGIGKTRLLLQLVREPARQGARIITCGAQPPRGEASNASLSTIRPLLAQLADYASAEPDRAEELLGDACTPLGVFEPRLCREGQGSRLSPDKLKQEARRALTQVLERWSAQHPLFLLLDDLQWADSLTLAWLAELVESRAFADHRILVIGSFRTAESTDELNRIASHDRERLFELEGIDPLSILGMAADMLALPSPPVELADFLIERAHGSPFFVSEYLRAAVGQGLLTRGLDGAWQLTAAAESLRSVPLPSSLASLVALRFSRLDRNARRVAELASVFGRRVDSNVLFRAHVLAADAANEQAMSQKAFDAAVQTLVVRSMLEPTQTQDVQGLGQERLVFAHDKLHEVAYANLDLEAKRRLHLAAALALEELPDAGPTRLRRMAQHFESAGQYSKAVHYSILAGRAAEGRGALADALSSLEQALKLTESHGLSSGERLEAVLSLGELETGTGRMGAAGQHLLSALNLGIELNDTKARVRANLSLSYLAYLGAKGEETMQRATEAAELAEGLDDATLLSRAENALGIAWGSTGHYRRAISHYSKAAKLAESSGDRSSAGKHHGNISINQRLLGELEDGLESAQQAVQHARSAREGRLEANALCNRGRIELELGRLEKARLSFTSAIELANRVEMIFVVAEAVWGLGVVELESGDLATAKRCAERAKHLSEQGFAVTLGLSERLLGQIALREGDPEGARKHLETSVEQLRPAGERDELADSLMALAEAMPGAASALRSEALAIYRELDMQGRLRRFGG
ncbi:MAG: protein kinase [Polyangiaceae bacterium]|nr:protein kinase [Polyangiaceae bacterium]